ncbi:MAG: PepSY-like domain-containing protein [Bacteroidota bacterium]|nr:PepSY-like domain-containing protein [Bacteroidota bacterium]
MKVKTISFFLAFILLVINAFGQVREIPKEVKETFNRQYSGAENIRFDDNIVNVQVHFTLNGEKMVASYYNQGRWTGTEKEWTFEQLSQDVKSGFEKSKYADWKILETKVIYRPGDTERYKIKVEKNDLQKKNLFFNKNGRLVDDSITI